VIVVVLAEKCLAKDLEHVHLESSIDVAAAGVREKREREREKNSKKNKKYCHTTQAKKNQMRYKFLNLLVSGAKGIHPLHGHNPANTSRKVWRKLINVPAGKKG
jgi:hypothetical protein